MTTDTNKTLVTLEIASRADYWKITAQDSSTGVTIFSGTKQECEQFLIDNPQYEKI